MNAGQHCWKACWGQPLASSNLASSATLTCYDALGLRSHAVPCPTARVSFSVSVWVLAICLIPDKSVWWCAEMTHVVPGQGCRGRTSMEPRTPLKRAHRRSGQAGTVRRPGCRLLVRGAGCRQVTDRITLIEKFEENARDCDKSRPVWRKPGENAHRAACTAGSVQAVRSSIAHNGLFGRAERRTWWPGFWSRPPGRLLVLAGRL